MRKSLIGNVENICLDPRDLGKSECTLRSNLFSKEMDRLLAFSGEKTRHVLLLSRRMKLDENVIAQRLLFDSSGDSSEFFFMLVLI